MFHVKGILSYHIRASTCQKFSWESDIINAENGRLDRTDGQTGGLWGGAGVTGASAYYFSLFTFHFA